MIKILGLGGAAVLMGVCLAGCSFTPKPAPDIFPVASSEASWIKDGESIVFEETEWVPQDNYDVMQDSEMELKGEYRGVQFFVEKLDVRPYNRLYTKFAHNKFRIFYPRRE